MKSVVCYVDASVNFRTSVSHITNDASVNDTEKVLRIRDLLAKSSQQDEAAASLRKDCESGKAVAIITQSSMIDQLRCRTERPQFSKH